MPKALGPQLHLLDNIAAGMGRDLRFHLETTDEDEPYVAISGQHGTVLMLVPDHNLGVWVAACGAAADHIPHARDMVGILSNAAVILGLTQEHHALHREQRKAPRAPRQ